MEKTTLKRGNYHPGQTGLLSARIKRSTASTQRSTAVSTQSRGKNPASGQSVLRAAGNINYNPENTYQWLTQDSTRVVHLLTELPSTMTSGGRSKYYPVLHKRKPEAGEDDGPAAGEWRGQDWSPAIPHPSDWAPGSLPRGGAPDSNDEGSWPLSHKLDVFFKKALLLLLEAIKEEKHYEVIILKTLGWTKINRFLCKTYERFQNGNIHC